MAFMIRQLSGLRTSLILWLVDPRRLPPMVRMMLPLEVSFFVLNCKCVFIFIHILIIMPYWAMLGLITSPVVKLVACHMLLHALVKVVAWSVWFTVSNG